MTFPRGRKSRRLSPIGERVRSRRIILLLDLPQQFGDVVLAQRGWEIHLRDAAESVTREERRVRIGIGDGDQIIFGIVGVGCDMIRRVGRTRQPVRVVVGLRCGLVVLVGH